MTKKKLIPSLVLALAGLAFILPCKAQEKIMTVEENALRVSMDPFSNLFLLNTNREYKKYDKAGKLEARFSDMQISDLTTISSGHPFKSMLYFPEYDIIKVFGNKLQLLAELNLTEFGLGEISAVAPSVGYQAFWVFDATAQKLYRINQQFGLDYQGFNLSQILGESIFPTMIKEREGWLYVYDPEKGLYIFDNFGTFSRKVNVRRAISFSVFNDRVFFSDGKNVFEADIATGQRIPLPLNIDGDIIAMSFRMAVVRRGPMIEVVRF